jgi:hypothetical protein
MSRPSAVLALVLLLCAGCAWGQADWQIGGAKPQPGAPCPQGWSYADTYGRSISCVDGKQVQIAGPPMPNFEAWIIKLEKPCKPGQTDDDLSSGKISCVNGKQWLIWSVPSHEPPLTDEEIKELRHLLLCRKTACFEDWP